MASARIAYNRTSVLGSQIHRAVSAIVTARGQLEELDRILQKYVDGVDDIATDAGMSVDDIPLMRNLVTQAKAEMAVTVVVAVGVGEVSGSRQLADAMG